MTPKRYEFMTVSQLANALCDAPYGTEFDFTFDTKDSLAIRGEPEGWYGIKIIDMFNESVGTLCFGYYGGGCTQRIDLAMISDNEWNYDETAKAIEKQLKEWFEYAYDYYKGLDIVCVAVTEDNEDHIKYWAN